MVAEQSRSDGCSPGEAIATGSIGIDPPPEEVKAASVEFRLGPGAFLGTSTDVLNLKAKRIPRTGRFTNPPR